MTDYLEELLENSGALLEQVKRMEREPSPPGDGSPPASPDSDLERQSLSGGNLERKSASAGDAFQEENSLSAPELADEESQVLPPAPVQEKLEPPRRVPTPLEEEESLPSPLLEQLEQLERAASFTQNSAALGNAAVRRNGTAYPLALSKSGTFVPGLENPSDWSAGDSLERSLPPSGSELRWAEQADRAFRRDSRRYDGGFYLY